MVLELLKILKEFGVVPFAVALLLGMAHGVYVLNEIKKAVNGLGTRLDGHAEKLEDHAERLGRVEGRMDPGPLWAPRAK